jgi:hypothetical protein
MMPNHETNENGRGKMKSTVKQDDGLLGLKEITHMVTTNAQRKENFKRNRREKERRKTNTNA